MRSRYLRDSSYAAACDSASFSISTVTLTGFCLVLSVTLLILRQLAADVIAFVELPFVITPHESLVA